ncbi:unnamed protein product [Onchocerca flexuosa]|uniref:BACK domain-containing protein n=1 Tax=Onchocerca flexuosa TaxID=387005 RepID=A0A183H3X7_9BILA|nr:unnamed protein product [Onchocerca flexuosa]
MLIKICICFSFKEELEYDRLEVNTYLNWSANAGLKNEAKVVLGNGYACSAPACLLTVFSEVLRKLILAQISQQQLSPDKEIIIYLYDMPNITNAGLYNVLAFIQKGQIKFLETELEKILVAANDLRVISLVSLICEEMAVRISENTSTAIPLLYAAVSCLPMHSQYRNMVVDAAAKKFHYIVKSSEFRRLSFEMFYALISSQILQGANWVMEMYKAILLWLRNNIEQIYLAPALLDNINFKLIINTTEKRRDIIMKSLEVPGLGPIVQIFLMDAIYAQFLDNLMLSPRREQPLSSSIYTISGAETVNVPTSIRGPTGLAPSPFSSFIIPAYDSTSPPTTRSISTETPVSGDKSWYPMQQLPIESENLLRYHSTPINTIMHTAQESTVSSAGSKGRRLWSEVLARGLKPMSKTESMRPGGRPPIRGGFTSSTVSSTISSRSPHDSSHTMVTARSAPVFTYATAVSGQKETETAVASSPMPESIGIGSSSLESVSILKPRREFEQIPLRTEPPKSRKELRKERRARERIKKK